MDEQTKIGEKPDCCGPKKEPKGLWQGILYGLLPHTGCIAFILFTILGVSAATALFKPLLMNPNFFYYLIALSFVFATLSASIYLHKRGLLSFQGAKQKWKYLSILYGTTIGVNLILFMLIFPIAANMTIASPTGAATVGLNDMTLKVDIPCPGHAPLISEELKTIRGIQGIKFRFPDYFDVSYDSTTSEKEILGLEVFSTYKATKIGGAAPASIPEPVPRSRGCSTCGGCSGACGGSCG